MSDYTNVPYPSGANTLADYCEQLEKENYRLRCEKQADLNKIELLEFTEKQAYDRLAEEKAKSQRLVEALEGFLDDCHNPVFDDHRLAYVHAQIYRYTVKKSRQALKEYKGEK